MKTSKKELTPDVKAEIIGEIINTRDFCGDEQEVMREYKHEYAISERQECEIAEAVAQEWNKWRKAARKAAQCA